MIRATVVAGTALALALLVGCGGSDSSSNPVGSTSPGAAEIVSPDSLRETASEAIPIYWAGEQKGTELELSRPEKDRTFVRYLTGGAKAGDKRADFLTVGTYAQPNAVASLRRQAKRSGGTLGHAPGNATVYYNRGNAQSVYLAYPGTPVEVEVFDPSFKRALRLVESGQVVAVE
ncbi:MAG TPA: hypothetical protein VNS60_07015 [Solirubrobacterales bacterium]|jgi:hypothetical protein|nr:hypothetical protein [Solirubrobacterales bacterium]